MAKQKRFRETDPDAPIWAERINELLMNERYGAYVSDLSDEPISVPQRTQAELAAAIGVSESTVSGWVNGKVRNGRKEWPVPSASDLGRVARFFGVSTDYLLGLHDVWGSFYDMPHRVSTCAYLGLSRNALSSIEEIKGIRDMAGHRATVETFENTRTRKLPIDTLNMLLCERDFILLIHEYVTSEVVCEAEDFALNDTKADAALLHIISELMWMRKRHIKTRPIPPGRA